MFRLTLLSVLALGVSTACSPNATEAPTDPNSLRIIDLGPLIRDPSLANKTNNSSKAIEISQHKGFVTKILIIPKAQAFASKHNNLAGVYIVQGLGSIEIDRSHLPMQAKQYIQLPAYNQLSIKSKQKLVILALYAKTK